MITTQRLNSILARDGGLVVTARFIRDTLQVRPVSDGRGRALLWDEDLVPIIRERLIAHIKERL